MVLQGEGDNDDYRGTDHYDHNNYYACTVQPQLTLPSQWTADVRGEAV